MNLEKLLSRPLMQRVLQSRILFHLETIYETKNNTVSLSCLFPLKDLLAIACFVWVLCGHNAPQSLSKPHTYPTTYVPKLLLFHGGSFDGIVGRLNTTEDRRHFFYACQGIRLSGLDGGKCKRTLRTAICTLYESLLSPQVL